VDWVVSHRATLSRRSLFLKSAGIGDPKQRICHQALAFEERTRLLSQGAGPKGAAGLTIVLYCPRQANRGLREPFVSNAQTVSINGRDVVAVSRRERYFARDDQSKLFGAYAVALLTVFTREFLLDFIEGVKGCWSFSSTVVSIEF
jgi:hypothetical protein